MCRFINKKIVFVVFLLCVCVGGTFKVNAASQNKNNKLQQIKKNRLLIWHDEFDGKSLDTSSWLIQEGYLRNNELQYYTEDAIEVKDGVVTITAKRDRSHEGYEWISGEFELRNKMAFQNCYMEARIRMNTQKGFCPAYWAMGESISGWGWAKCGEVDVFEVTSPGWVKSNTHAVNDEGKHFAFGGKSVWDVDLTQWHTYALELKNGKILIYLDSKLVQTVDTTQYKFYEDVNPFKQAMFPIFNIAVGGAGSAGKPEEIADNISMSIDWFRVYSNKNMTEKKCKPAKFKMKYLGNGKRFDGNKLKMGDSVQLFPVYTPVNCVKRGLVKSKVYNKKICTCSNGYITAVSPGTTKIKFKDSNGLTYTLSVTVVENKSKKSIDGKKIEDVKLNSKDIWISGWYGQYLPGDFQQESTRITTSGMAMIEPDTSYVKLCDDRTVIWMYVTVFDKNKKVIQIYRPRDGEFTTSKNARYCSISLGFPDKQLAADNYTRLMELVSKYEYALKKK